MFRIYDLFLAMGIGWSIYGALNILTRPNRKDRDTIFALAVLVCFTIPIIDHLIKPSPRMDTKIYLIFIFTRNIYYLIGPILWLYTRTLLKKQSIKWQNLLIHCLPFIIWVVITIIFQKKLINLENLLPPGEQMLPGQRLVQGRIPAPRGGGNTLSMVKAIGSFLSAILYGGYILYRIRKHSKQVQNFYSNKNKTNTLSWLRILILSMIILYIVFMILELFNYVTESNFIRNATFIQTIPPVIYIFFFSYFSNEQHIPEDTKTDYNQEKYKKSALDESSVEKIFTDLTIMMKERKLFLNPDLTLNDLAEQLGFTKHNVSQVINIKTESNFYYLVNSYRIEEFKMALKENRFPHYTLIAIAFECGFRSSSAFYSIFKKITAVTPKEYMESLKEK